MSRQFAVPLSPNPRNPDIRVSIRELNLIGSTIGPYHISSELGRGGMAVVYEAEHTRLGRKVALKLIPPGRLADTEALSRFESEARIASSLNHPNVCTIYDADTDPTGTSYIAMERVHGRTLAEMVGDGPVDPGLVMQLMLQAARGLEAAHKAGIIHRDVKSANIMVTPDGLVKIMDFGLARAMEQGGITLPGHVAGTAAYMSPEQARGEEVGEATDIWSLGLVMYEMLAGVRPWDNGYPAAVMYALVNEDPPPLAPDVEARAGALSGVVFRCLEKLPENRYASMSALIADLELLVSGNELTLPAKPGKGVPSSVQRSWIRWGLAGLATLILISLGYQAISTGSGVPAQGSGSEPRRLAILPFTHLGSAQAQDAKLSEGLLHSITSSLIKLGRFDASFSVISAHEVLSEGVASSRAADSLFGASQVIIGTVETSGDKVTLILDLVDTKTRSGLNTVTIEAETGNLLAIQDRAIRELSRLMDLEINLDSERALTAGGTTYPEAYRLYLEGKGHIQWYNDEASVDLALSRFDAALAIDDLFADAWAGLGEAAWRKYLKTRQSEWLDKAIASGERALNLNRESGAVNATLGLLYRQTGRQEIAQSYYRRALELEPTQVEATSGMGRSLQDTGRREEAEPYLLRAVELRPDLWWTHNDLGVLYTEMQRNNDALKAYSKIIPLNASIGWHQMAMTYDNLERVDDAIGAYQASITAGSPHPYTYANLGAIYLKRKRAFSLATEMYESAIRLDSLDYFIWGSLADARQWDGSSQESMDRAWRTCLRLAEEAIEVNPENVEALLFRALARQALGRASDVEDLRPLTDRKARLTADEMSQLGEAFERFGLRDSALVYSREALGLGANASWFLSPALDSLRTDPRFRELLATAPR